MEKKYFKPGYAASRPPLPRILLAYQMRCSRADFSLCTKWRVDLRHLKLVRHEHFQKHCQYIFGSAWRWQHWQQLRKCFEQSSWSPWLPWSPWSPSAPFVLVDQRRFPSEPEHRDQPRAQYAEQLRGFPSSSFWKRNWFSKSSITQ